MTRFMSDVIAAMIAAFRCGYERGSPPTTNISAVIQAWEMGVERRLIDDAIWTIQTYGRARVIDNATIGQWYQIDHDRSHRQRLDEAVAVLETVGLIEHHPTLGNPRNVRIIEKFVVK